jgi:hypothetical protein
MFEGEKGAAPDVIGQLNTPFLPHFLPLFLLLI